MFTRPKHIIYSSDSKPEQKLFICVTVAAEATGAPCAVFGEISPERSGLLGKARHGASRRFDLFRVIPTAGNSPWLYGFYLSQGLPSCSQAAEDV